MHCCEACDLPRDDQWLYYPDWQHSFACASSWLEVKKAEEERKAAEKAAAEARDCQSIACPEC